MIEKDSRWWGGGYWHQNTREIFWPTYGANHVELAQPFFELYGRAAACARQNGRVGLGVDGFYIPEWIPINVPAAKARREIKPPGGYTAFIFTVGLEVSLQAWWRPNGIQLCRRAYAPRGGLLPASPVAPCCIVS